MGYIQDIEKEAKKRLSLLEKAADAYEEHEVVEDLIKWIKVQILESFRNGIMAGKMDKAGKQADRQTKRFARGRQ